MVWEWKSSEFSAVQMIFMHKGRAEVDSEGKRFTERKNMKKCRKNVKCWGRESHASWRQMFFIDLLPFFASFTFKLRQKSLRCVGLKLMIYSKKFFCVNSDVLKNYQRSSTQYSLIFNRMATAAIKICIRK